MKYLLSGGESKERVLLMLKLTKINSEPLRDAVTDHLVKGFSEKDSAELNDIPQQNFNRAMVRLNEVAGIVEDIKNHDWAKFKSGK